MKFVFTVETYEEPTEELMRSVLDAFNKGMVEFVKLAPAGVDIRTEPTE